MRLNRFMAMCGVASRRACDEIIESGRVRVNAVVVKKLGTQVDPQNDFVVVDGRAIRIKGEFVYYMINKPCGYITSVSDPQGRKTVLNLVPETGKRLFPIGRLDYNTSGLLLITNDGDLAQKLTHPSFEFGKTYVAEVLGNVGEKELAKLRTGIDIGGFVTSNAKAKVVSSSAGKSVVELTIHEGKNRQVRRMFEALNKKVVSLKRISIGKLTLGKLGLGECRELTQDEVRYLKEM